jgi:hypothetical protein
LAASAVRALVEIAPKLNREDIGAGLDYTITPAAQTSIGPAMNLGKGADGIFNR